MVQPAQLSDAWLSPFCIHGKASHCTALFALWHKPLIKEILVLNTQLRTLLPPRRILHIALTLPSTAVLRTHSLRSERNLEWNRRYEFTSPLSRGIKIQLVDEGISGRTIHGEARISVEDLLQRCQGTRDCTLELRKPSSEKARGYVTVRLEQRSSDALSHELVSEELSHLEQDSHLKDILRDEETNHEDPVKTLDFLLDQMKPFIRLLGAASMMHPALENAQGSVSSLYKVYHRRKSVDAEIKELLRVMRSALKFVQDTSSLKDILFHSQDTVEKLLGTIHKSSQFIHDYLDMTAIGQIWRTESNIKRLEEYKKRLESLRSDLYGDAIGSLAHKSTSTDMKGLHVVIPPPPTGIFTGRDDYLDKMERFFDLTNTSMDLKTQRRFVLYGVGGAGKTQLALKFSKRNSDKFTKQFMIDASSKESIALSFANIGDILDITDADESKVLVRLSQLKEDWLLIYDNADNLELRLSSFFPNVAHGNIIITTRNAELINLAPNGNIEVLMLDEEAAIHLLLQSSRLEENEPNRFLAQTLVTKFGCLALAIVQAGSYISSRHLDLHKYLKMYETSPSSLLRAKLGQDIDYKSPVFATWEISFEGLSNHAQTLLNIFSFLYRDGITEEMIRLAVTSDYASEAIRMHQINGSNVPLAPRSPNRSTRLMPSPSFRDLIYWLRNDNGEWNEHHFEELMYNLRSHSLVQRQFSDIYSIHPLVHQWARDRLGLSNQEALQQDAWLLLYCSTPPQGDSTYVSVCRMLLPHLSSCDRPTDVVIMEVFASIHRACGRWKDAENFQVRVVEQRLCEVGKEHTDSLSSTAILASIYWHQGRWAEAEKLMVEVLEARRRVLGLDHPDTLTSMANLASTYWNQGRWIEAEKLDVEVLEASNQVLGPDHPDTLMSMANLASTYRNLGRWNEAEKLGVEVLEASRRVLGADHPDALTSLANLALTYQNQGRWTEAEKLDVEVLEVTTRMPGPDHPDTLTSMANLASTYGNQGRWAEAEELELKVLEARRRVLGPDHPDTLTSMANLALTYWNRGRHTEAERLGVEVLETRKRVLGPDHPNTHTSMANLALTYCSQGRWTEAEKLGIEVLEARRWALGTDHPDILRSTANLASTYRNQGRRAEAEKLDVEVLEKRKRTLGLDHPDTLTSMNNLAGTLQSQGRLNEAVALLCPALEPSKRVLGPQHPHTLLVSRNLISLYYKLGRPDEADALKSGLTPVDSKAGLVSKSEAAYYPK